MEILMMFVGVWFIVFGLITLKNPMNALQKKDKYRLRGKREYTDYAKLEINLIGILLIMAGIFVIVIQFLLLFVF